MKIHATLIFLLILATAARAEDTSVSHFPGALLDDVKALPTTENLWWILGGTALTIGVYQFEDAEGASEALNQGALDAVSDFGNIWGDARVQGTIALGCWGIGSWADGEEVAGLGYDLSRGLLLTYATVSILKPLVDRTRPNGDPYSFPSGHTAAAFNFAGVISKRYGGWPTAAAVTFGVFTAMGRMEDMKHYASDVAAGATIGWIFGRTAGREHSTDGLGLRLVPVGRGLAVAGRF